jgi:hypothetical protein
MNGYAPVTYAQGDEWKLMYKDAVVSPFDLSRDEMKIVINKSVVHDSWHGYLFDSHSQKRGK